MTYEKQEEKWTNRLLKKENSKEFMFVAENENDEIIGFSTGALNKLESEVNGTLYTLYVREDYQSKGIGKLLIKEVANKLKILGAKNLILSCLADNKSCYFYEHLGGIKKEENLIEMAGTNLKEVIYKWDDIKALSNL